jgi:uncharacterized protein (TIGR01777 family)
MRIAVTGGTGLIGRRLVQALRERGDHVTVLSRSPGRAKREPGFEAVEWHPADGPAPSAALEGCDGVVNLLGENVAQRWTESARREIRESRELGTRNLVAGMAALESPPAVLVSASAVGYYGSRGAEIVTETEPAGDGFLAEVCTHWEREASRAQELGVRVVVLRTGVLLDGAGGALAKMLRPFRMGVGGPVAGGEQYVPWIHGEDLVGMQVRALDDAQWSGAFNASAPEPVTNRELSKALGRALGRPAILPVPAAALRLLYGEMAEIVTEGQRAVPKHALDLGFEFRRPQLDEALRAALDLG